MTKGKVGKQHCMSVENDYGKENKEFLEFIFTAKE